MKKSIIYLFAIAALFVIVGCDDVLTVNLSELEKVKSEWQEPKVSIWYYLGSQDGYQHFLHHDINDDIIYKIPESELPIDDRFSLTRDRNKWRVMPWGTQALIK